MSRTAHALCQRRLGRAVASLRRAGCTARARPAAIATRRWRHTHGPRGALPPPAPAGEGGRVAPSRGRHSACSSRSARDAPPAAHTWAARRTPSASAGRGGQARRSVARAAQRVLVPPRSRRAAGGTHLGRTAVMRAKHRVFVPPRSRRAGSGTHMGRTAYALCQRRPGRVVASLGRAGGTALARPAALAMRQQRHTRGLHGASPLPAPAGEGGRVARSRGRHSAC